MALVEKIILGAMSGIKSGICILWFLIVGVAAFKIMAIQLDLLGKIFLLISSIWIVSMLEKK